MSGFNPFQELANPYANRTLHNVLLVDVHQGTDGVEQLTVEYKGQQQVVVGTDAWSDAWSRNNVGRRGYLATIRPPAGSAEPVRGCSFRAYLDPSLRRIPELDTDREWGWTCDARPSGLRAPVGLIPGMSGDYVPDETVAVTVRVPPEFVRACRRVQLTPEQMLRGFVADAAGVRNDHDCPRADGLSSNGSDERDMAEGWIDRAYGMNAVDLDDVQAQEAELEELQALQEEFGMLAGDFLGHGGEAEVLRAAVVALIERQCNRSEAGGRPQEGSLS